MTTNGWKRRSTQRRAAALLVAMLAAVAGGDRPAAAASVTVFSVDFQPQGLAISPARDRLYAADMEQGRIVVFDTSTLLVEKELTGRGRQGRCSRVSR